MYRHSAESIKESSRKMFVSLEEKTKYNNYENTLRSKDDSYSKTEVDNKIKELSDNTYGTVESTYVSESNTLDGYIKDLEIIGNTVQNEEDLSDIKSVGELQEDGTYKMSIVSCGKNLLNLNNIESKLWLDYSTGQELVNIDNYVTGFIKVSPQTDYYVNYAFSYVYRYDENKNYINYTYQDNVSFNTEDAYYIRLGKSWSLSVNGECEFITLQLEEGTIATEYEPYKESRVNINLPCQLEKVGDISDRLYYDKEEKAWCIEKNIETYYPEITKIYNYANLGNTFRVSSNASDELVKPKIIGGICNVLPEGHTSEWGNDKECCYVSNSNLIVIKGNINNASNLEEARTWITTTGLYVKYATKEPKKIILPLDVQIQLNSFASKTHIYTISGDIEGTIKATLPKSLCASVQTLNDKTDMMIDRIKNVETLSESQAIRYESDNGYVICQETKDGVVDDISIKGRTLVNLYNEGASQEYTADKEWIYCGQTTLLKEYTEYTVILQAKCTSGMYIRLDYDKEIVGTTIAHEVINKASSPVNYYTTYTSKFKTRSGFINTRVLIRDPYGGTVNVKNILILEGDYTENPPSFFEGVMSVGGDVDEIKVLSRKEDGNLLIFDKDHRSTRNGITFNIDSKTQIITVNGTCTADNTTITVSNVPLNYYYCEGQYSSTVEKMTDSADPIAVRFYNGQFSRGLAFRIDSYLRYSGSYVKGDKVSFSLRVDNGVTINNAKFKVSFYRGEQKDFPIHKSHKKSLLYYNDLGELTPVPELHEWDSIEKHDDGKWYYHKRSEKVVLNGSESWYQAINNDKSTYRQAISMQSLPKPIGSTGSSLLYILCDKLNPISFTDCYNSTKQGISLWVSTTDTRYTIEINKGFSSVDEVRQWLSSNNVTVVYRVAEEQVYECVNLNLDTYDNETLVLCNGGAVSPNISFNISSHIGNTVSILRERLKSIEEEYIDYKTTQDKLLLTTIYSSDRGSYSVSTLSTDYDYQELEEIDYELFEITKSVIEVGLNNYNITDMEELIDFYTLVGKFDYDMADVLFEMIENQINPPVIEIPEEEIEILPEI